MKKLSFEEFIKEQMSTKNLEKRDILAGLGIARMTLYRYEKAKAMPEKRDIEAMARYFQVTNETMRKALTTNYIEFLNKIEKRFF